LKIPASIHQGLTKNTHHIQFYGFGTLLRFWDTSNKTVDIKSEKPPDIRLKTQL
jgi:hypothetical protein